MYDVNFVNQTVTYIDPMLFIFFEIVASLRADRN